MQNSDKSKIIISNTIIDAETGEILKKKSYVNWSGWRNNAYQYRAKAYPCKIFFDAPFDLTSSEWKLFLMLCKIMNNDNLFIETENPKKQYQQKKYTPLTKKDIYEFLKYRICKSSFEKAWKSLKNKYIKQINVNDLKVWAVNPAFAAKIKYLPLYLYIPFKEDLKPFLSDVTIKKFENLELEEWK